MTTRKSLANGVPAAVTSDDGVSAQVLAVVAQITGYPPDMLDLDLDLEADLGISGVNFGIAETGTIVVEPGDDVAFSTLDEHFRGAAHRIGGNHQRLLELHVIPVLEEERGGQLQAVVQPTALQAQLVVPEHFRIELAEVFIQ